MNAEVARKIRRLIFGELSKRSASYGIIPKTGQIVCRGLRGHYRNVKRFYKEARRQGRDPRWIFSVIGAEGRRIHEAVFESLGSPGLRPDSPS
jgi:hypothetical protein